MPERMSRDCSTICSRPVWSVDVPIVSGPGRPYSNSLVSNWVPPPTRGYVGGNRRGRRPVRRITRKRFERVVTRTTKEGGVGVHGVTLFDGAEGVPARRETAVEGRHKGREGAREQGDWERKEDNDWNKIFTAATGAGP